MGAGGKAVSIWVDISASVKLVAWFSSGSSLTCSVADYLLATLELVTSDEPRIPTLPKDD
jgi:hypothetical protein